MPIAVIDTTRQILSHPDLFEWEVPMALPVSHFAEDNIPILLNRYEFFYRQEDRCVEYFIKKKGTKEPISRSLVFSFNQHSRQINVAKFYPELNKQTQCKYLSAACFYLLAHHFASAYVLPDDCRICLETLPETHWAFYSKLRDFHFHVEWVELCKTAHVCGTCPHLDIDVSAVKKKTRLKEEMPFLV